MPDLRNNGWRSDCCNHPHMSTRGGDGSTGSPCSTVCGACGGTCEPVHGPDRLVPMPPDLHALNAGRAMTMQQRRRARRAWRRKTRAIRHAKETAK